MEHNKLDEMARQATHDSESKAELDSKQADMLWAQIGSRETKTYVGWWRAAAIILFLVSSSLLWYGSGMRNEQQDLASQLESAEEEILAAMASLEQVAAAETLSESADNLIVEAETITIRDTVVSYIVEETIVYVDREVLISPVCNSDSLLAIIHEQQKELNHMASYAQVDHSKEYLSNFNVVFDDSDSANAPTQSTQKQASFKFNLSLLKRN